MGRATSDTDLAAMHAYMTALNAPYDAARMQSVFSVAAVFHDVVAHRDVVGLPAIEEYVSGVVAEGITFTPTSDPTGDGEYVTWSASWALPDGRSGSTVERIRLSGGKVTEAWSSPAP